MLRNHVDVDTFIVVIVEVPRLDNTSCEDQLGDVCLIDELDHEPDLFDAKQDLEGARHERNEDQLILLR